MLNGEEEAAMPPNSTQNLNGKLSLRAGTADRSGAAVQSFAPPPIQSSAPPVQIVGGSAAYRGGYHLSSV
jgi:hypothetical protein